MEIWLDTADLDCISRAEAMGVLYGITTNPSIVAKSKQPLEDLLEQMLKLQTGPVTAQVTADKAPLMIKQAEALYQFSPRLVVKVPVTAEGLKTLKVLSRKNIPSMATAIFDVNQVLLAARAGAVYIAPYFSRICEADIDGIEALKSMLHILNTYKFPSKLIAASLRTPEQVKDCAALGVHAATLNEKVFDAFIATHPSTEQAIHKFSKDWEGAKPRRSLPL